MFFSLNKMSLELVSVCRNESVSEILVLKVCSSLEVCMKH